MSTMHLGKKLKLARVAKGWSQEELAEKINKTRPLISHIEQTGKVNSYTLNRICKALNIPLDELENTLREQGLHYETAAEKNQKKEIEKLKDDISLLKDLVETQKEIIKGLKEKLDKRKGKKSG